MRTSVKFALTALAASLLLAAVVGTASASRLSVSNQNIRATWSSLEFDSGIGVVVRCPVTLEGSFHTRTIAKVARSLIGAVTKAQVRAASCVEGTGATFNGVEAYNGTTSPNTLPWHLTYESFSGTLPNITAVRILLTRFRFGITVPGFCTGQYGAETDRISANASVTAGVVGTITPIEGSNNASLIRRDGGISCPNPGRLRGSGNVFLLGTTNRISITLI